MPKKRSAYFCFISQKARELDRNGQRCNMTELFGKAEYSEEWKAMGDKERSVYENMAKRTRVIELNPSKKSEPDDILKRFRSNGKWTSLKEVWELEEKRKDEERKQKEINVQNWILKDPIQDDAEVNTRTLVIMKINAFRTHFPPNTQYWPMEIAVSAFNLYEGQIGAWWTLVDPKNPESQWGSSVKELVETTYLPYPCSEMFLPIYSQYGSILEKIRTFLEFFGVEKIHGKYPIFVLEGEEKLTKLALHWLWNNKADYKNDNTEELDQLWNFLISVKFISTASLLLKLAAIARQRTPGYAAPIALSKLLISEANEILINSARYENRKNLGCPYHIQNEESAKMPRCALNCVQRTTYLIFDEVIKPLKISKQSGHYADSVPCRARYKPPEPQLKGVGAEVDYDEDDSDSFASYNSAESCNTGDNDGANSKASSHVLGWSASHLVDTHAPDQSSDCGCLGRNSPQSPIVSGMGRGRPMHSLCDQQAPFDKLPVVCNENDAVRPRGRGRGSVLTNWDDYMKPGITLPYDIFKPPAGHGFRTLNT